MTAFENLYKVELLPIFQNSMYLSEKNARECAKGDLDLVQDLNTGLIYNQAFNPALAQYSADYQNEQAVSSLFREHLNAVTQIIFRQFHNFSLTEVGCGKGFFLEHLQGLGFQITGLDPAYEGSNPSIIRNNFSPALGLRADGIVLRHVLEHIQDPVNFLADIRLANGGNGKIYIEVPCFDWICRHHAWFDIFYEHVNYFRMDDFRRMFCKIYESGYLFGGQYLYIVADLASLRKPDYSDECPLIFPKDFLASVDSHAKRLKNKIRQSSVIWGGASKGVIFAVFMERAGATIDFVVDINPAKQGKYLPATGLRVYSPEEVYGKLDPASDIFVMNSNYLQEIKELTHNRFCYRVVDQEEL